MSQVLGDEEKQPASRRCSNAQRFIAFQPSCMWRENKTDRESNAEWRMEGWFMKKNQRNRKRNCQKESKTLVAAAASLPLCLSTDAKQIGDAPLTSRGQKVSVA